MHVVSLIVEVALAVFVVSEVVRFVPRYRQLKEAVANGDTNARTKTYQRALVFDGSARYWRWRRSDSTGAS
jgi:predicted dehydrogenase